MDMVFRAQGSKTLDLGSGVDDGLVTYVNPVFDNGKRADRDAGAKVSIRVNYR
jgi:hypothetical protein